jgi:hypothetical protein
VYVEVVGEGRRVGVRSGPASLFLFALRCLRTQFAHIPFASSVRLVCVDVQSVHRGSTPKT